MLASVHEYIEVYVASGVDNLSQQTKYNFNMLEKHSVVEHTEYYNNSPYGVVISKRSGVMHIVRPPKGHKGRELIIVTTFEVSNHMFDKFVDDLERSARFSNVETKVYVDAAKRIQHMGGAKRAGFSRVSIHYMIEIDRLLAAMGSQLYVHNLDMVVSLDTITKVPPHPFSNATSHPLNMTTFQQPIHVGCTVMVDVIDNKNEYGVRYVNALSRVHKVAPRKSPNEPSGVMLRYQDYDPAADEYVMRTIPMTFKEADECGHFFRTIDEASVCGDIAYIVKKKQQELTDHINTKKAELELKTLECKSMEVQINRDKIEHERRKRDYSDEDFKREVRSKQMEQDFRSRQESHERQMKEWEMIEEERRNRDLKAKEREARELERLEYERAMELNAIKHRNEQFKLNKEVIVIIGAIVIGLIGYATGIHKHFLTITKVK